MALDADVLDRLFSSPKLPSMPAIAMQIIELVQEDEVDIDKIAETIRMDPALATKLLKTVNSSFYGLPKRVGSVHQAVVVLGLNSVKTLALGFSLVSNLTGTGGEGFDHAYFWQRSLYCATAAKQLCETLNIVQAEEVFMASLLQDVGVLAFTQVLDQEYAQLMAKTEGDHRRLAPLEQEELGADHCEVGAALAESWGLPPLLVDAVRLHERSDDAPEAMLKLIRVVEAGGFAADLIDRCEDGYRVSMYYQMLEVWFGMDRAAAEAVLDEVFKKAKEIQALFDLPAGELPDPEAIMTLAREAMLHVKEQAALEGASSAKSAAKPGESNPADAQSAETAKKDELTGLPNRRMFEEKLDELFLASGEQSPLSLLFVDLDRFEQINEALGQVGGDAVIRRIAHSLNVNAGAKSALVYRYDQEDFTLLCPGMNRLDATMLAEQLRTEIDRLNPDAPAGAKSEQLRVTASIGVATYDGGFYKRSEQLVKAARKGVAVAKEGGRNLVRVFVPKKSGETKAA